MSLHLTFEGLAALKYSNYELNLIPPFPIQSSQCLKRKKKRSPIEHTRAVTHLLARALTVSIAGDADSLLFAPVSALQTLVLVLLVYDFHLHLADEEGHRTQPEADHAAHYGVMEEQRGHRQQHQPPQGQEAAEVRGPAKQHADTPQDEEGWKEKRTSALLWSSAAQIKQSMAHVAF